MKSIYATPILLPWSISSFHFSNTCSNCSVVDLSEIKPNCIPVNRSFAFMCFTMLSRIIDSNSLHGTLVRLTGPIISWVFFVSFFKDGSY